MERGGETKIMKKKRRKTCDIERSYEVCVLLFECHFEECKKLYGTETSLKNHIKIKHKF